MYVLYISPPSCSAGSISPGSQEGLLILEPLASTSQRPLLHVLTTTPGQTIIPHTTQTPTLNYDVAQANYPSAPKAEKGGLPQVQGQPGFKPPASASTLG